MFPGVLRSLVYFGVVKIQCLLVYFGVVKIQCFLVYFGAVKIVYPSLFPFPFPFCLLTGCWPLRGCLALLYHQIACHQFGGESPGLVLFCVFALVPPAFLTCPLVLSVQVSSCPVMCFCKGRRGSVPRRVWRVGAPFLGLVRQVCVCSIVNSDSALHLAGFASPKT